MDITIKLPDDLEGEVKRIKNPSKFFIGLLREALKKDRAKPVQQNQQHEKWSEQEIFGMWKDRKDMEDVGQYVRNLRKPRSYVS